MEDKYEVFINNSDKAVLMNNEVLNCIKEGKIQHSTSIRKYNYSFWTNAGALIEFRAALISNLRNRCA